MSKSNLDTSYTHLRDMERDLRGLVDLVGALMRAQEHFGAEASALSRGVAAAVANLGTLAEAYADVTDDEADDDETAEELQRTENPGLLAELKQLGL